MGLEKQGGIGLAAGQGNTEHPRDGDKAEERLWRGAMCFGDCSIKV